MILAKTLNYFVLGTCRELKTVAVHFSPVFTVNNSFETNYLSTIQVTFFTSLSFNAPQVSS